MKTIKIFVLFFTVTIALTGCDEDDNLLPPPTSSNLIIYNGATSFMGDADASKALVYIDTSNSPRDYPGIKLSYNYVYPGPYSGIPSPVQYMALTPGDRRLRFGLSDGTKITDRVIRMEDKTYQTAYLADSLSYLSVLVTRDTLVRLEGKTRLRLVSLSPDAGDVQLYLDETAISGLESNSFKSFTPFKTVEPTPFVAIRIRGVKDGVTQTLIRKSIPLVAGRSYTAILRGYITPPDGDRNKLIDLSVLINQ